MLRGRYGIWWMLAAWAALVTIIAIGIVTVGVLFGERSQLAEMAALGTK